ncbi:unnamed protein product [Rotaria sp. Silwood1]|nr:unnamed protein product [Rotaria sp. Silwood1]CAF1688350.1 unnamed protein product [Rotaria sp. Silwood1]
MESSFLSSQYFDGGLEFSNPFIGFGINTEYLKNKTTTNALRQIYLTYCLNFPRVTLELDLSYLELTSQFIEAIDNVLSIPSRNEQIIKLKEVLSTYGHVYPRQVVLGGQLYHTEIHHNQDKAEEAKKRISAEASFFASIIKPAKIYVGGGSENQLQNKSSNQTSLLSFQAIGGDTRLHRDPTLWTDSVAEPSLWRIIEQDNYQSVITLLDQERQQKLQRIISYPTMKGIYVNTSASETRFRETFDLFLDTKWKQYATTVAGGNGYGNQLNQLDTPFSIFIDNQSIYIADWGNHRIVEWKSNEKYGQIIAGGNRYGDKIPQLNYPTNLIIDKQNNSFIVSDWGTRQITQWSRQKNANGRIIIENIDCVGIAMDNKGYLYASDWIKNEVRRWKIGDKDGTLIAGGNGKGDNLNQLDAPGYIFVDKDYSLYISDWKNHRVMKWIKDAKEGIIVAGGNGPGNTLRQLASPRGVIVDQCDQIYAAERDNNRITRWCEGDKEGSIVVGGNGQGEESNQLYCPMGLSFDLQQNLYVVDCENHRIQKFEITSQ